MHRSPDHPATAHRTGGVTCPGVDRVAWVRVLLADGQPSSYAVHGTRHRRPVVVSVPVSTARALIDAGVPAIVRDRGAA